MWFLKHCTISVTYWVFNCTIRIRGLEKIFIYNRKWEYGKWNSFGAINRRRGHCFKGIKLSCTGHYNCVCWRSVRPALGGNGHDLNCHINPLYLRLVSGVCFHISPNQTKSKWRTRANFSERASLYRSIAFWLLNS